MSGTYLELIISLGLLLLGLYIFHNHLICHISRTCHKVSTAPDVTSPIALPYVRKLHKYLSRRLSLDILHQLTCRETRRRRHKQMGVISRNMTLQDLPGTAAQGVGIAQGALEMALKHVKKRKQFGQPLSSFQMVQGKLAEMATWIEAARNSVYKAAWSLDKGQIEPALISMAKWYAGEIRVKVVNEALQLHGG